MDALKQRRLLLLLGFLVASCGSFSSTGTGDGGAQGTSSSSSSGGPFIDGGETDARSGADASAPKCMGLDFCDDFEIGALTEKWTDVTATNKGSIALASDAFHGGKQSVKAFLPAVTSKAIAQIRTTVPTSKTKGRVSTWMFLDSWTGTNPVQVLDVLFLPSPPTALASVQLATDGFKIYCQMGTEGTGPGARVPPPLNKWFKLTLAFDRANGSAEVLFDDVSSVLKMTNFDFGTPKGGAAAGIEIHVGLSSNSDAPQTTAWFDDVELKLE